MVATPHIQHFRHRLYPRLRYGRKLQTFLTGTASFLTTDATAQVVAPLRTVNTKAEALVVVGGNLSNTNTLTIGNVVYTLVTALTEVKAAATLTNDTTDVTAADTVTIDGKVYTFKTALTEVKAAATLTNDATNITNADTVTVDGKVYTFQDTLTNVDGHVLKGVSATASMTNLFHAINGAGGTSGTDYAAATVAHATVVATNPTATTVVVTAKTPGVAGNLLAVSELSTHLVWGAAVLAGGVDPVLNEVKRGVSATASMTALFEAINAGANAGTDYSTGTIAHTTVVATNPTAATVVVTAKTPGVAGNLIAVTEASTHLAWGAALLAGGVDAVPYQVLVDDTAAHTRDNLVSAINGTSGAGTKYATGTATHPLVLASAATADLLLTTLLSGTPGKAVRLAKSAANLTLPTIPHLDGPSWTATGHGFTDGEGPYLITTSGTRPAGTPLTGLWAHVIDTNHVAFATSLDAMAKGDFIKTSDAGSGTHSATKAVTASGIFDLMKEHKPRTIAAATDIDDLN